MASPADLEPLARALVAAPLEHGSRDNITVLVVRECVDGGANGH